jgi:hypothetical protein
MRSVNASCLSSQVRGEAQHEMLCLCLPRQTGQTERMKATRSLSWAWLLVRKERIFLGMYDDDAHGGEAGRFWPLLEHMWDGVNDEEGAVAEPRILSFAWLRWSRADWINL